MKTTTSLIDEFAKLSLSHKILVVITVAVALQIAILVTVAMVSLVREAWDPPTYPDHPDHYNHRPPQDVIDAGRLRMAEEMKQWAEGGPEDE